MAPSFPDCNPLDYHVWNKINKKVCEDRFNQTFRKSDKLKKEVEKEVKKVWREVAYNLTETRKTLKQFTPRLKVIEEKKDSQLKWNLEKLIDFNFW